MQTDNALQPEVRRILHVRPPLCPSPAVDGDPKDSECDDGDEIGGAAEELARRLDGPLRGRRLALLLVLESPQLVEILPSAIGDRGIESRHGSDPRRWLGSATDRHLGATLTGASRAMTVQAAVCLSRASLAAIHF